MRCEQLIIHVRQNSDAVEAEVERMYLLALLEDLAILKASVSGAKTRWSWNWPPSRLLWIKSIAGFTLRCRVTAKPSISCPPCMPWETRPSVVMWAEPVARSDEAISENSKAGQCRGAAVSRAVDQSSTRNNRDDRLA